MTFEISLSERLCSTRRAGSCQRGPSTTSEMFHSQYHLVDERPASLGSASESSRLPTSSSEITTTVSILHKARHTEYTRSRSRDCGSLLVALKLRQPKSWCTLKALTARLAARTNVPTRQHKISQRGRSSSIVRRQDAAFDRAEPFEVEGAFSASGRPGRLYLLVALQLRESAPDIEREHGCVGEDVDTPVGAEWKILILRAL
eukprot:scaffold103675_cov70-Phaeocystis_antarctica.AAC.7